jgi:hypothetical protein
MGYIYSLVDPRDNEVKYIGQTRFDLKKRYNEHLRNSKYQATKNHNVYCWINELKCDGLMPIIQEIEEIGVEQLNEREKYWISQYDCELKNMTVGGDGIRYINKRKFSEAHKKKIGDSCKGDKHYNYNKPAKNIKSVLMFNLDGNFLEEFSSIKIASESTKIKLSGISNCLNGRRKSAGGYLWIFKNEFTDETLKKKVLDSKNHPSNKRKSISVLKIDVETNEIVEEYQSYKEAARMNKTSDATIKYVCVKSKTHIFNNYLWKLKTS